MYRYFKRVSGFGSGNCSYFWKSKGLSDENISTPNAGDHKLNLELSYCGTKTRVEFSGRCLRQEQITFNYGKIVNIYIAYEISKNYNIRDYPTLENCLFGTVSLTKNADIDNNKHSGYGIGFDRHVLLSHRSDGTGRNVVIFGV